MKPKIPNAIYIKSHYFDLYNDAEDLLLNTNSHEFKQTKKNYR